MIPHPEISFQRTPVTLIITATAAAIELVCLVDPSRREAFYLAQRLGILSPLFAGEIWRPFTTSLLHGNLFHALFNIYWMATFGTAIELKYGSYRTLGLIVLLAYMSIMPQFLVSDYSVDLDKQVMIVGLSGILYGLFAFTWATRRHVPEFWLVCDARIVQLMLAWLVICIVATRLSILPVANTAHISGLLFGGMYGLSLYGRYRWQWLAVSIAATLLVLATMFYAPGHNGYEYTRQIHQTMLQKWFGD